MITDTYHSYIRTGEQAILHNIIIWFDGTLRPMRGHNQCNGIWRYDGQVFIHGGCNE